MGNKNMFWGILLVLIGIIFLADKFYIMDIGNFISTFWPVILIFFGVKIILDRQKRQDATNSALDIDQMIDTQSRHDHLNESNSFGDIVLNVVTEDFVGGKASNVFGDIKIDLTLAKIQNKDCKIFVNSIFGDITVITPKGVPIKASANAFAGDILIKGNRRDGILPKLEYSDPGYGTEVPGIFVQGSIIFGSVNIV